MVGIRIEIETVTDDKQQTEATVEIMAVGIRIEIEAETDDKRRTKHSKIVSIILLFNRRVHSVPSILDRNRR